MVDLCIHADSDDVRATWRISNSISNKLIHFSPSHRGGPFHTRGPLCPCPDCPYGRSGAGITDFKGMLTYFFKIIFHLLLKTLYSKHFIFLRHRYCIYCSSRFILLYHIIYSTLCYRSSRVNCKWTAFIYPMQDASCLSEKTMLIHTHSHSSGTAFGAIKGSVSWTQNLGFG